MNAYSVLIITDSLCSIGAINQFRSDKPLFHSNKSYDSIESIDSEKLMISRKLKFD